MTDITDDFVNDLFNIPRDGSNISEEDEGIEISETEATVPFDQKAAELVKEIASLPPVPQLKVQEKPVAEKLPEKPVDKPNVETAIKNVQRNRFADALFDEPKVTVKSEPQTPVTVVTDEAAATETEESVSEPEIEAVEVPKPPLKTVLTSTTARWQLTTDIPKYQKFYEEKADILSNELLKGGEIPFDQYYDELEQAAVDVDVPTWDVEEVGRRIALVQKWRDRIKHIQLHANKQYFVWERFMDLLPGVLARIEYERGKQEGHVYEHLSDFEGYFGALKGLHKSCEMVSKNLDAAYASLSRQAAIVQPLNEVERWTPKDGPRQMTAQQQKYDSISSTNANRPNGGHVGQPKEDGRGSSKPTSGWDIM